MSRYDNTLKYRLNGTVSYGVRRPLPAPERQDDRFHQVVSGDSVDSLAHTYLGDASLWWVICDWNGIAFPLELMPGVTLRIPSRQTLDLFL